MLTLSMIQEARGRIASHLVVTPVVRSGDLDREVDGRVYFKCENLQVGGAFKARGAFNAVYCLTDREAARGVATHSSGNHAVSLALAARSRRIPAWIVMPHNVARAKVERVQRAGAEIICCEPTVEAREAAAAEILAKTGAVMIHPYNDLRVMAGQGTAAMELLEQAPPLDEILAPVSGGGLLSGTAVAAKSSCPGVRVVATEPAGAADAMASFRKGEIVSVRNPQTIADGLRASLGTLTFPVIRRYVDDVVIVSEEAIRRAMRQLWEELHLVVEPSSAVPWAAVIEGKIQTRGRSLGIILTGGNVDLDRLPWQD